MQPCWARASHTHSHVPHQHADPLFFGVYPTLFYKKFSGQGWMPEFTPEDRKLIRHSLDFLVRTAMNIPMARTATPTRKCAQRHACGWALSLTQPFFPSLARSRGTPPLQGLNFYTGKYVSANGDPLGFQISEFR